MKSAVLTLAALVACGRGQSPAGAAGAGGDDGVRLGRKLPRPAFLKNVPADTPYAFAALTPMPAAYLEREYLSRVTAYQPLADAFSKLRRAHPDKFARLGLTHRLAAALVAELGSRRGADILQTIGLDRSPRWILYGVGASPVIRVELRDPSRTAAALGRVMAWLAPFQRRALAGVDYYLVEDGARRWVFAVSGRELVVAILSADRFDANLDLALGTREPSRSLASERILERVAGEVGVAAFSLGYVDTLRLASHLATAMPVACRDELAEIAALAPRISFGVRAASDRRVQMVSLVELRRDVASALVAMRGEMPGPEPDTQVTASLTIGLAIDVAQASTILGDAFDRISAHPYACGALDWLNRLAREQGSSLGWVAASPFGKVDGLIALVFAGDAPAASGPRVPTGGVVLLGAEQPSALLSSIAGLLPIGIPTSLVPGDPPVVISGGLGLPLAPLHVGLGKRALGFAAGGHEAELAELLAASPDAEPPLFYLGIHLREAASLFGLMRADAPDPALAELEPDLARKLAEIDGRGYDRFEELELRAVPTAHGLEIKIEGRYPRR